MPVGTICAQLIHAAGESSPGNLSSNTIAVGLAVDNEIQLLELEQHLISQQIPHHAIREPDEPYCGALMAIGICPSLRTKKLKRITSSLRLIR